MEETITFWLDNKICSGFKVAVISSQTLVLYREKYYVVVSGAALMKGVRPLHYSKTSMPLIWKKALKGILPVPIARTEPEEDAFLPTTTPTKKERNIMPKNNTSVPAVSLDQPLTNTPLQGMPKKSNSTKTATELKPSKILQTVVAATCPYCNHKQDLPMDKGKNGKPFFTNCARCATDFAVRFVPVTLYQAQVAAFK